MLAHICNQDKTGIVNNLQVWAPVMWRDSVYISLPDDSYKYWLQNNYFV